MRGNFSFYLHYANVKKMFVFSYFKRLNLMTIVGWSFLRGSAVLYVLNANLANNLPASMSLCIVPFYH